MYIQSDGYLLTLYDCVSYITVTLKRKNAEFIQGWQPVDQQRSLETGLHRYTGLTTDRGAGRAPRVHTDPREKGTAQGGLEIDRKDRRIV